MTRMDRIVVLMNARGSKKNYPIPAGAPLHDVYEFHGEKWRVVDVIDESTINARTERAGALHG